MQKGWSSISLLEIPWLETFFQRIKSSHETAKNFKRSVDFFPKGFFLILNDFSDFSTHHQIYSPLSPLLAVEDTTSRTENNRRIFLIFLNFISFWQLYNIFPYNYFSWCGLARSKVRASPSAPAFIERVNKAIVEQASPAYLDQSMITLRKINN